MQLTIHLNFSFNPSIDVPGITALPRSMSHRVVGSKTKAAPQPFKWPGKRSCSSDSGVKEIKAFFHSKGIITAFPVAMLQHQRLSFPSPCARPNPTCWEEELCGRQYRYFMSYKLYTDLNHNTDRLWTGWPVRSNSRGKVPAVQSITGFTAAQMVYCSIPALTVITRELKFFSLPVDSVKKSCVTNHSPALQWMFF